MFETLKKMALSDLHPKEVAVRLNLAQIVIRICINELMKDFYVPHDIKEDMKELLDSIGDELVFMKVSSISKLNIKKYINAVRDNALTNGYQVKISI